MALLFCCQSDSPRVAPSKRRLLSVAAGLLEVGKHELVPHVAVDVLAKFPKMMARMRTSSALMSARTLKCGIFHFRCCVQQDLYASRSTAQPSPARQWLSKAGCGHIQECHQAGSSRKSGIPNPLDLIFWYLQLFKTGHKLREHRVRQVDAFNLASFTVQSEPRSPLIVSKLHGIGFSFEDIKRKQKHLEFFVLRM